jgi:hypothetical protein
MFRTPSSRLRKGTDREKPSVRMVWGACDSGEVPERERPPDFNEQVTVNSEQVSVGRGVPPSRQHERNTNMNDTTKSKAQRATDERFVARGRRAYWENGRLVRSMDGPCAAPATGGTPVVPVRPPPTSLEPLVRRAWCLRFARVVHVLVPFVLSARRNAWKAGLPGLARTSKRRSSDDPSEVWKTIQAMREERSK